MKHPPGPPMTLGNVRDLSVQRVCELYGPTPRRERGSLIECDPLYSEITDDGRR